MMERRAKLEGRMYTHVYNKKTGWEKNVYTCFKEAGATTVGETAQNGVARESVLVATMPSTFQLVAGGTHVSV